MLGRWMLLLQQMATMPIAGETAGQATVSPEHAPPPRPKQEDTGANAGSGGTGAASVQGGGTPSTQASVDTPVTGPMVLLGDGTQVPFDDYEIERPDGRKVKVKDGIQFQDDYTRKTQEAAQIRRQAEQELQNAQAWRQWYEQQAQSFQSQSESDSSGNDEFVIEEDEFASDTERRLYDYIRQQDTRLKQYEQRFQQYDGRFQTWDQQAQDAALDQAIQQAVLTSGLADMSNPQAMQQATQELIGLASERISDANNHIQDLAQLQALRRENERLRQQLGQGERQAMGNEAQAVAPPRRPPTNTAPQRGQVNWRGTDAQRVRSIQERYPNLVSR